MYEMQTTAADAANAAEHDAQTRATNAAQGMLPLPLPQRAKELAQWWRHDASNYDFAASLVQHRLVTALDTLSEKHGLDWMSRDRLWSHHLAAEIARGLEKDGCLFSDLYEDTQHSTIPIRGGHLRLEDIAELGYDVSSLTHEDLARFAYSLRWYGGDIKETAEREFHLPPLVSRERLRSNGFDDANLTDEALLEISTEVHHQMAGFAPSDFPQDFETAIRSVAKRL